MMKAVVQTEFGPPEVLRMEELEKPVPKNREVLIRVRAVSVNYGDVLARNFSQVTRKQFNKPAIFLFWRVWNLDLKTQRKYSVLSFPER